MTQELLRLRQVYCILSSILHTLYIENDAEIFPAHYTWKVAEKGFKMAFMMNKLAMNNSCEIILENKNNFFVNCEIQVPTILLCALYSIKYGICQTKII